MAPRFRGQGGPWCDRCNAPVRDVPRIGAGRLRLDRDPSPDGWIALIPNPEPGRSGLVATELSKEMAQKYRARGEKLWCRHSMRCMKDGTGISEQQRQRLEETLERIRNRP